MVAARLRAGFVSRVVGPRGRPNAERSTLADVPERYGPNAALIVVDMQNDFADPKGSLFVQGAPDVLPMVNSEARRAP